MLYVFNWFPASTPKSFNLYDNDRSPLRIFDCKLTEVDSIVIIARSYVFSLCTYILYWVSNLTKTNAFMKQTTMRRIKQKKCRHARTRGQYQSIWRSNENKQWNILFLFFFAWNDQTHQHVADNDIVSIKWSILLIPYIQSYNKWKKSCWDLIPFFHLKPLFTFFSRLAIKSMGMVRRGWF